jgi:hypothetical protein
MDVGESTAILGASQRRENKVVGAPDAFEPEAHLNNTGFTHEMYIVLL